MSTARDDDSRASRVVQQPYYFIVVCWGRLYAEYLMDFCVGSLLSPRNIPALKNNRINKFLIACPVEDWDYITARPNFTELSSVMKVEQMVIPPCPPETSSCVHMGIGHKIATEKAFRDRACAVLLTPDLLLSDGTISNVQDLHEKGKKVILTAALRFATEPLFTGLSKKGLVASKETRDKEITRLNASGRELVDIGLRSFHSETLRYEIESNHFSEFPVAAWYKVPNQNGILVYSLSWAPLLVDYSAIEKHDSSMMDNWTIDGDYIHANFSEKSSDIHACLDSDEMMLVSWAPWADREQKLNANETKPNLSKMFKNWIRLLLTFYNPVFDDTKRKIFFTPSRWHTEDIDDEWRKFERQETRKLKFLLSFGVFEPTARVIPKYFGFIPTNRIAKYFALVLAKLTTVMSLTVWFVENFLVRGYKRRLAVVLRALSGDKQAWRRIASAIKFVLSQLRPK